MSKKIGMVSLGCPKNQCDAELMLARLRGAGYEITNEAENADCVIVNTCAFIESAKQESIDEIIELGLLKKESRLGAIVVTGCLAERYADDIIRELPEADGVVCIGCNGDIVSACERAMAGEKPCLRGEKEALPMEGARVLTTPPYYAYLRVADGCDNRCAYCAIPNIRGRFRSRPIENIVDEARELAGRGVREFIVIAQDTTRYGEDIYGEKRLPELLDRLCEIEGVHWLRLLYCYPDRVSDELLDIMARRPEILKYLDLPLQHCSREVLANMNRRGSREQLLALVEKIRARVPGITLRTTLMVGFPGETEEQFAELTEFVREAKFERLGCFVFSPEEDTPAFELPGRVDPEEGERRMEAVLDMQSRVIDEWCEAMQGKELELIVEGYDKYAECCYGRSVCDAPEIDGKLFFTTGGKKLTAGEFVKVRVNGRLDSDLLGELV